MNYLMVTNWNNHWDNLAQFNYSTLFTIPMIHTDVNDILQLGRVKVETTFIKKDKQGNFEKAWKGMTSNFRKVTYKRNDAIRFEVEIREEVNVSNAVKYQDIGWHQYPLGKEKASLQPKISVTRNSREEPPFFMDLNTCGWKAFEDGVYKLLRLIGIHEIHQYPQDDNRGKADGFFKFENLSVLYDATLDDNFNDAKEQQIENYINQMKKEKISIGKSRYSIKDSTRQVWIVNRGRKVEHHSTEDRIKVKIIPYHKLIELYHERLNVSIGADRLWDDLKDL